MSAKATRQNHLYCPQCQDEVGVLTEIRNPVPGICDLAVWVQCPQCDESWTVTPQTAVTTPRPGVHERALVARCHQILGVRS